MVRALLGAVAEAALSRPRAMLGGAVVLLIVFALLALGAPGRLGVAAPEAGGSESDRAAEEVTEALGREPEPGMLIVTRGRDPVRSGVYEVALTALTAQAKSDPEVAAVRRGPVSEDELTTVLEVHFRDDDPGAQQQAVERIEAELDPGILTVQVAGEAATLLDARRELGRELVGLELLALPLTMLVIALVAGLRLAVAPLLSAALAILGSITLLRLLGEPLELSMSGIFPAAAVALALGVELSLLVVRRHRDDLERDGEPEEAIERAVRLTGRPILAASAAGGLVPLALLAVPVAEARSAAIGAAAAALLSGAAALAVTPSLLALAGPRAAALDPDAERPRAILPRVTGWVGDFRVAALLTIIVSVLGLLAAAWPAADAQSVALSSAALPADSESRRAEDRLAAELGIEAGSRATVSLPAGGTANANDLREELSAAAGVASVGRPVDAGDVQSVAAGLDARRGSLVARDAVRSLRSVSAPAGAEVGGYDAAALDADDELDERLPLAAGIAALVLAVLVFALVRRPFLAVGLGLVTPLPAAAAIGLLALVFGEGRLTGALDYAPQGGPQLSAVLAVVAGLLAVSAARNAAYPLALRGERAIAVRERPAERVARLALPAAGAATAIAAAASVVLVGSDVLPVKEAGIALAVGLVLDLVALRVLLVPGLGRLLQRSRL